MCRCAMPCHHTPFVSQLRIAQVDMHQIKKKSSVQKLGNTQYELAQLVLAHITVHINYYMRTAVNIDFACATACYFSEQFLPDPGH